MFSSYAGSPKVHQFATPVGSSAAPKSYDFVVCGAGSAGAVLASRLSEDPNVSVLLIEAGESDQKQLFSKIPAGWGNLFNTPAEWGFNTVPQAEASGRQLYQPRGRMLGGCSSINAMIYQRGSPSDFDEWDSTGAPGWSWSNMRPYFEKSETYNPHPQHQGVDRSIHGNSGPLQTGYTVTNEISAAWLEAGVALGVPRNDDINVEAKGSGISRFQTTIGPNGVRSSTSAAYLPPKVYSRKNLTILTSTYVTRLLFNDSAIPRATGVEVGQKKDGERWFVRAEMEVIVCLGAFASPQLLLASGVGPAEELKELGIPVVKALDGVGKHLKARDRGASWEAKSGASLQFLTNPPATLPSLARWLFNGSGALSTNLAEVGAFLRSDAIPSQTSSIPSGGTNASGPTSPDLEILNAPLYYIHHALEKPPKPSADYFTLAAVVLRPLSEGTIKISSANTFDAPLIDPRYLTHELDKKVLLEGMKFILKLAETSPLKEYLIASVAPANASNLTDEQLLAHMSAKCDTIYHPSTTCKIGDEAKGGVVTPLLKVHGSTNLRVCDASVFPDCVSAHPNAAVIAVAERCADLIKSEWGLQDSTKA
ncbi:hypothetical protein MNV49_004970 [Pseudohyphozyma bogoriensis]|nr:hypothetical protein MNV49_004970 [Pseudohyphozyma bogoriensis]